MAYPYSRHETLADGVVHAAGLIFAVPASFMLVDYAATRASPAILEITLYAVCLTLALTASAVYHMCPWDKVRPVLHRIDHAAIYIKIAGSFTPIVAVLGSGFAYGVLGIVWTFALIGALAKLLFWPPNAPGSLAVYIGMGWLSALLVWPMSEKLNLEALILVITSGLIYLAGTRVFAHPGMAYQNAIWHCYVLTASICLFCAIALSI